MYYNELPYKTYIKCRVPNKCMVSNKRPGHD